MLFRKYITHVFLVNTIILKEEIPSNLTSKQQKNAHTYQINCNFVANKFADIN